MREYTDNHLIALFQFWVIKGYLLVNESLCIINPIRKLKFLKMKKVNYLSVLLIAVLFFAVSCGKDGATGPQGQTGVQGTTGAQGVAGVQGETGAIGPAGPTGANGKNGSVIYSGITIPATSLGAVGDFYLNTTTGLLYGPKTAAGWGTGFSLKGPTGATGAVGAAGSQILNGSGIPSAALGNNGDYYLDKTNYLLYGPKTNTGWGPAVSLKGPAGTANVQYSGWNYASNIRDTTVDGSSLVIADLSAPAITQAILDNASIQMYLDFGAGVFPMPYTSNAGGKESTISYLPMPGRILISRFTADNSASISLSTLIQYRYVIIPGSVNIGLNNHVNLKDYEAVRKFYRIPD